MKKIITFFVFSFLLVVCTMSQPQYYNANSGGIGNSLPFGSLGINGYKTQWLIGPGEYIQPSPAPAGNITKLYIWMSTSGSGTYTQLTIKMGQTALTTFPTGTIYSGQLDTVYYNVSGALSSTTNTWMSITLTRPFLYNPAQSLVIEVSHCGFSGSGMNVWQTQGTTGIIRRNNIQGTTSCVFTYGSQDTRILQNGIDIAPVLPTGWIRQNPSGVTTSLNTVSVANASVGWIGGNGGVVLRTINAGTNWTNVTGSPIGTADVYAICGIDANTCLVSTTPNATFVYRTSNGGVNWTQVFTQATGFIDDIKFQNTNTGFMYGDPVGTRWSLWKSTNGGVNWDSAGLYLPQAGSEAGWNNAMWLNGNNLWFGTNNTKIYYSSNFGANWSSSATTGSVNSYSVAFNAPCPSATGFTGQTVALKSTNCGPWSVVTLPGSGTIYSFNSVLNRFWYCRTTNIYWSSDNGANFSLQFADTGTYQAMNLKTDGQVIRGWAVTSNGRIARYNEILEGITSNQNNLPENYSLLQNYPNPFNPSTTISYSLPKAGDVKLIVFDILGREVATLVNGFIGAGNHTVDFNASNLSSGVYLYKIQTGDFTETRKMVLIK